MKKFILTAAAVSLSIMFAAAGTASAETRSKSPNLVPTTKIQVKTIASSVATAGSQGSSGPAWTAGCYAEFGPDATHPDAALLKKCLN